MTIDAKDIVLMFLGAVVALPITAGWQTTKDWLARRGQKASEFENSWQFRLKSSDAVEQRKAVQELAVRASVNFILGNVMVGVGSVGIGGVAVSLGWDEQGITAQMYVGMAFSLAALIYFAASMRWLRRLLRASK